MPLVHIFCIFFFFNDTATTEIYTLSLHDALPISPAASIWQSDRPPDCAHEDCRARSEEHTSELQSRPHIVCRLLLEKKKKNMPTSFLSNKNKKQYKNIPIKQGI